MRHPIFRLSYTFLFGLVLMIGLSNNLQAQSDFEVIPSSAGPLSAERSFEFTYEVTINVPKSGSSFSVHVPMPQDSQWQQIRSVELYGDLDPSIYHDSEHGNRILRYEINQLDGDTLTIQQTYSVKRQSRHLNPMTESKESVTNSPYYQQYLEHHEFMKTNDKIKKIARSSSENTNSYRYRLRSLYDRVLKMMAYDKSGQGWGRGDISYCLKVGEGNCTDFHTLFASIAREDEIPSRFLMGFPIPRTKEEGTVGGYHCWAESYVPGKGWFPMDISEADKHEDLEDFYFGTLDADRILFTSGKKIPLSTGKTVNYLIYPVVDGNENVRIEKSFSFQDI